MMAARLMSFEDPGATRFDIIVTARRYAVANETTTHDYVGRPAAGNYESPDAVLDDDNLTRGEKQAILEEWRSSLRHIALNEPDVTQVELTMKALDQALERLSSGKV